jgi:glutamine amidotransferase
VQQTNCHPFRHGRWLWMHNGFVEAFGEVKRDLVLAIDPTLYPALEGHTDSEILFLLALTLGLEDDPAAAVAATIGLVEQVGRSHGAEHPFQGTIATSDGERLWAFRYSSVGQSRSLFFTRDVDTLRRLYPDNETVQKVSPDARLIVSEPIGELPGAWNEVPEASYGVVGRGEASLHSFRVSPPTSSAAAGA